MKELVIIGAGGYGREIYWQATESLGYKDSFIVKGFLDDNLKALDSYHNYPPIIGAVVSYVPDKNDVFICALGNPSIKKKCSDIILEKGGEFISLIHKDARVSPFSTIGMGCIICQSAIVSCDVKIGDFVTLQSFSTIGHDAIIGNYCQLNSFSFMGGFSSIGESTTMNVSSILHPYKKVGRDCIVGAGAVVIRNFKDGVTLYGNPAKIL